MCEYANLTFVCGIEQVLLLQNLPTKWFLDAQASPPNPHQTLSQQQNVAQNPTTQDETALSETPSTDSLKLFFQGNFGSPIKYAPLPLLLPLHFLPLTSYCRNIEIEHDYFSYSKCMFFDVAVRFQNIESLHTALSYFCGKSLLAHLNRFFWIVTNHPLIGRTLLHKRTQRRARYILELTGDEYPYFLPVPPQGLFFLARGKGQSRAMVDIVRYFDARNVRKRKFAKEIRQAEEKRKREEEVKKKVEKEKLSSLQRLQEDRVDSLRPTPIICFSERLGQSSIFNFFFCTVVICALIKRVTIGNYSLTVIYTLMFNTTDQPSKGSSCYPTKTWRRGRNVVGKKAYERSCNEKATFRTAKKGFCHQEHCNSVQTTCFSNEHLTYGHLLDLT